MSQYLLPVAAAERPRLGAARVPQRDGRLSGKPLQLEVRPLHCCRPRLNCFQVGICFYQPHFGHCIDVPLEMGSRFDLIFTQHQCPSKSSKQLSESQYARNKPMQHSSVFICPTNAISIKCQAGRPLLCLEELLHQQHRPPGGRR